ncbi:metallophosphoesterase family protein [Rubrivirga sp.]|uniref:metallophosphoesterase family protein n=1 Tax=Rubrivirga sp. TaxID=1885344 RepID=UPI003B51B1A1
MSDASASVPGTPYPCTLAHLSDVHFGRIADDRVVSALVDEVNAGGLDLVVVSGDLTQRARRREFRAARAMLDAFEPPVLVVPGNHDVRAWWHHPVDRLWRPSKRFRRFISDDTTPTVEVPGLAAFGLNSAHGWTIKGGRIRREHVREMEAFFAAQPAGAFRVLVVHHHLLRLDALGDHDVSRGARRALGAAQRSGVELVLCGHLHRSHVEPVELARPGGDGHRLVIASAGTATSNRGRGSNRGVNVYNWVEVGPDRFTVCERRFDPGAGRFHDARQTAFDREPA